MTRHTLAVTLLVAIALPAVAATLNDFSQTNLVSDGAVPAANIDAQLINPWGVSFGPTSPFWISDNGAGVTTLYNGAGTKQGLVVTIPKPGGGTSAPTGQVFNGTSAYNGDLFIFASEDGTITGWRGSLGTTAETLLDNSASGSVYKGIATATIGSSTYLYATDFHNNAITVLPSAGAPALTGTFTDPSLPAGYAPFNIEQIGGKLYVTYAKQNTAKHDDVAGPGNGFIDQYDLNGNLITRVASGGVLNSPWGLALDPAGVGPFAGDLLVGNFGDGTINAFNLSTDTYAGTLDGVNGLPLVNDGLWTITFGNGGPGFNTDSLYLTAGLNHEADGLFARVDQVPEPGCFVLLGAGLTFFAVAFRARYLFS